MMLSTTKRGNGMRDRYVAGREHHEKELVNISVSCLRLKSSKVDTGVDTFAD